MERINDENAIFGIIRKMLEENSKSVEDYKAGKDRAMSCLVGQTIKPQKAGESTDYKQNH
ncbi:MAG: hypothetical protein ACYCYE_18905 [Clostridia bacterium]